MTMEMINPAMLDQIDYIDHLEVIDSYTVQYRRKLDYALVTQYNGSDVVIKYLSGRITLNSNGDRTGETKKRINKYGRPFKLLDGKPWMLKVGKKTVKFEDGMSIHRSYIVTYKKTQTVFNSVEEYLDRNSGSRDMPENCGTPEQLKQLKEKYEQNQGKRERPKDLDEYTEEDWDRFCKEAETETEEADGLL